MKFSTLGVVATSLLVLTPAFLAAQPAGGERDQQPTPRSTQAPRERERASTEADAVIATWLFSQSTRDVALAQIALQMAKNDEVRQFAQGILDDHAGFAQRLQSFAETNALGSLGSDRVARVKPTQDPVGNRQAPAGAGGSRGWYPGVGFDHGAMIREFGAKCLESESRLLREQAGPRFDRFYVDLQVVAQLHTVDMIQVFGLHVSAPLRFVLEDGNRTMLGGLEQAKALARRLGAADEPAPKPTVPAR